MVEKSGHLWAIDARSRAAYNPTTTSGKNATFMNVSAMLPIKLRTLGMSGIFPSWSAPWVALVAGGMIALTVALVGGARPVADGRFDITLRPQSDDDRAAIATYGGEEGVNLADARLLARDDSGRNYLIVRNAGEMCRVIINSSDSSAGSCDGLENAARNGIGLKTGDGGTFTLAVLLPDEYEDAQVESSGEVRLRTKNLLVVSSSPNQSDTVRLESSRFKDLEIKAMPKK